MRNCSKNPTGERDNQIPTQPPHVCMWYVTEQKAMRSGRAGIQNCVARLILNEGHVGLTENSFSAGPLASSGHSFFESRIETISHHFISYNHFGKLSEVQTFENTVN